MRSMRSCVLVGAFFCFLAARPDALGQVRMSLSFSGYVGRAETLTSFPVLVVLSNNVGNSRFTYDDFVSSQGHDLRVRNGADTAALNYEIESWNSGGASYVWVQAPELRPDGTSLILLRWGDEEDAVQLDCTTNGST